MKGCKRLVIPIATSIILGLALGACGVDTQDRAVFEATEKVPFGLSDPSAQTTVTGDPPGGSSPALVCFVGSDTKIRPVTRRLADSYPPGDLITSLVAGPTNDERSLGLTTTLADADLIRGLTVDSGLATVDLDRALAEAPTADQLDLIGQLVCTLSSHPAIERVRFSIDGSAVEIQRGDGSTTSDPVTISDYNTRIAS